MKIAIPLDNGKLSRHFGDAPGFALFDVDPKTHGILQRIDIPAPPHQPALLPAWLGERGVTLVIANGMGKRAMALLSAQKIDWVVGAEQNVPETLIASYFDGILQTGENLCSDCFTVSVRHPKKK